MALPMYCKFPCEKYTCCESLTENKPLMAPVGTLLEVAKFATKVRLPVTVKEKLAFVKTTLKIISGRIEVVFIVLGTITS